MTFKIQRILDANYNRTKEGLRVCEDVCRFVLNLRAVTGQLKDVRHEVTGLMKEMGLTELIVQRDIERDVGKATNVQESQRKDVGDLFLANMARVKESIRVLEEFSKLIKPKNAQRFKTLRYQIYAIEKKVTRKL